MHGEERQNGERKERRMNREAQEWKHEMKRPPARKEGGSVEQHSLRISAVAYLGIMESVVSSGCRMQPCV